MKSRISELKLLEDGWLDGEGKAPDHAGLDKLEKIFTKRLEGCVQPRLYPTIEGGISAEWDVSPAGGTDATLEVNLTNLQASWHVLRGPILDMDAQDNLDLNSEEAWDFLLPCIPKTPD
jgi:hypothetical protein